MATMSIVCEAQKRVTSGTTKSSELIAWLKLLPADASLSVDTQGHPVDNLLQARWLETRQYEVE